MQSIQPLPAAANPLTRRWPFFLLGILLFLAGPLIYVIQFRQHYLATPWYVPALATLGGLLMIVAVWQRWGWLRAIGLGVFVLVCAFEWFMVAVATRTPAYTGPAQAGHAVPAFTTTLADGTAYTDRDLQKGKWTILLFFRGRW